jgi:methionyl aminopeptidase
MTRKPQVKRELRSAREIAKMRAAGLVVWEAHQTAYQLIAPGVTTQQLNEVYRDTFVRYGAQPLFLHYGAIANQRPPFPAETCISINEELVHGIPGPRMLQQGDIVSLDTGCRLAGWCADAAVTHAIGEVAPIKRKLLEITNAVLDLAISLMSVKNLWSEIGREMENFVHDAGFSVIESMVGHGIGRNLHEAPQVPNYFSPELASHEDFDLRPGVVIAVEPMISVGTADLFEEADCWTLRTADRKPSAHFEHTIALTTEGPVRLTGPPDQSELPRLPPWLQDQSRWVRW